MGSGASKVARRFPVAKEKPSWAGARTSSAEEPPQPQPRDRTQNMSKTLASETKDEEITRDAIDPQFMANLSRLGAVRVDHHMQTVRTVTRKADSINRGFRSRQQSEAEAASHPVRNHLLAPALSDLLDDRKRVTSIQELQSLATRYGVDVDKLERLARYVNSPSADEKTRRKVVEQEEELTTVKVGLLVINLWTYSQFSRLSGSSRLLLEIKHQTEGSVHL
ncbi:hypothetical protein NEOLEDRAFT_1086956 [Neolentinus lepideus HHB14362 ss-1]|uniref:Uncharacterized protein n=1 Tax=Neolentinus lepideus HHB14362 ss-1 TaxID=1314782 RepID=A0A165UQG4_9AGAM|nr:hypothetical protein NEOLEDRAFT_1086956 [Neolentinus lepideus HHB14362 ss-1]